MEKREAIMMALKFIKEKFLISDLMYIEDVVDIYKRKIFYDYFYDNKLKGYLFCYNKSEYIFITDDYKILLTVNKVKLDKSIILEKECYYDTKTKRNL